tara:strand:- start:7564 stop:8076 length:513 start_codon:yes stop_codon:yes gene_type:complete
MSSFEGKEFLSSYEISRLNILKKIQTSNDYSKIFEMLYQGKNDSVKEIITESKLLSIIFELSSNSSNETNSFIEKFIKKFEISKKIFYSYDMRLQENSKNYKISRNYILFAVICIKKYEMTNNLKFLNTLLKLNDIICSVFVQINDQNNLSMIKYTLEKELEFVKSLKKV